MEKKFYQVLSVLKVSYFLHLHWPQKGIQTLSKFVKINTMLEKQLHRL